MAHDFLLKDPVHVDFRLGLLEVRDVWEVEALALSAVGSLDGP